MPSRKRETAPIAPKAIDVNTVDGPITVVAPPEPRADDDGEPKPPCDAMIYIPPITAKLGKGVDDVALRLANAMNSRTDLAVRTFTVATRDVELTRDRKVRAATILRHESARAEGHPILDLYEFNYRPKINRNFADKPPYRQALAIALTLFWNTWNLFSALTRPSKGLTQKLQVMYGAAFVGMLVIYLGLLLAAAVGTITPHEKGGSPKVEQAAEQKGPAAAAAAPAAAAPSAGKPVVRGPGAQEPAVVKGAAPADGLLGLGGRIVYWFRSWKWLNFTKTGIVILTLVGFGVRFNVRAALDQAAPALSSMSDYLSAGRYRTEIIGELARLIDSLDEEAPAGTEYRKVHLLAYSFGTVLAMDALFQQETLVSPRFGRINTLITIGSPFDFIRTFWPDYFTRRHALPASPRRWINVFSEMDVLGSNFLDDPSLKDRFRYRRAKAAEREAIEREWEDTLPQGVDLSDGTQKRPTEGDNLAYGGGDGAGMTFLGWLKFTGFRVHATYWDAESPAAVSCFEPVIERLYKDDAAVLPLASAAA